MDLEVDGEPRRVSLTANKMGFYDANEANAKKIEEEFGYKYFSEIKNNIYRP